MSARVVWPVLFAVGAAAEVRSLIVHDGGTLSETYRDIARTHTRVGRISTLAGLAGVGAWLGWHLCRVVAT